MRRRRFGCLTAIVVFVVLARLGFLNPISDWLWHWHELTTPWVRSPDGQWIAQVRMRGFMDSSQYRLFLGHRDGRPKWVCNVGHCEIVTRGRSLSLAGLQWSPDSRRVAGSSGYNCENYEGSSCEPWTIWVYDTVSKHEGGGWGEDTQTLSEKQMSERERIIERRSKQERIIKRLSKLGSPRQFKWRWRGAREIVGYAEDYSTEYPTIRPLFVYTIEDKPSGMKISWRIAE